MVLSLATTLGQSGKSSFQIFSMSNTPEFTEANRNSYRCRADKSKMFCVQLFPMPLGDSLRTNARWECSWFPLSENFPRIRLPLNAKMKILITGGCGFIGCNAARRFLQRSDQV